MNTDEKSGSHQLRYYIALAAPPTRAPVDGSEAFMRAEVGFNLLWFTGHCKGVSFSRRWHEDPDYRLECHGIMSAELRKRFPGRNIGGINDNKPADLLTGVYGGTMVAGMFGQPIKCFRDTWPVAEGTFLTDSPDSRADSLAAVKPESNVLFQNILKQADRIEQLTGTVRGYLNWQGVLNTAFRLRGEKIFTDLHDCPQRAQHVFECVATTMIRGMKKLYERQKKARFSVEFATISNCVVNMISPEHYKQYVLGFDLKIRNEFKNFGIHNCAWVVDPYMEAYATVPGLGYIDMGMTSDFRKAKRLFPDCRRNVLYTSMDMADKSHRQIRADFERIAKELTPCDVGLLNLGPEVSDEQVLFFMDLCDQLSSGCGGGGSKR
jgi:hypothetical protein